MVHIFGKVGAGGNADGGGHEDGQQAHHETAHQGIQHAASDFTGRRRHLGEQVRADGVNAFAQGGPENPGQEEQAENRGEARENHGGCIGDAALEVNEFDVRHQLPSRLFRLRSIRRAMLSTMKVRMNRTNPSASRVDLCSGSTASPNSLAIDDAMEVPGFIRPRPRS